MISEVPRKVELRNEKWNGDSQGLGEGDKEVLFNGGRISGWEDEKVLEREQQWWLNNSRNVFNAAERDT